MLVCGEKIETMGNTIPVIAEEDLDPATQPDRDGPGASAQEKQKENKKSTSTSGRKTT